MTENWKAVPGYGGLYEVSDLGRVRSYARGTARLLRPGIASHGYPTVALGRGKSRTVHSLVAEAFLGPRPAGQEVCHRDGDRANPALSNLVYGTRSENNIDASKMDRRRVSCAVVSGVKLAQGRLGLAATAKKYGISQSHVHNIWTGAQRAHG